MKYHDIIGYTADASVLCLDCLLDAGYTPDGMDSEGNLVHPIFAGDEGACFETCNQCFEKLVD